MNLEELQQQAGPINAWVRQCMQYRRRDTLIVTIPAGRAVEFLVNTKVLSVPIFWLNYITPQPTIQDFELVEQLHIREMRCQDNVYEVSRGIEGKIQMHMVQYGDNAWDFRADSTGNIYCSRLIQMFLLSANSSLTIRLIEQGSSGT